MSSSWLPLPRLGADPGSSAVSLLEAEVRLLERNRWRDEISYTFVGDSDQPTPVALGAPGASVLINSPDGSFYQALTATTKMVDADQLEEGSLLYGRRAIRLALRQRRAVLLVTLGNGKHD